MFNNLMHTLFSFCNNFARNEPFAVFWDALNARRRPLYSAQKFIEKFGLSEKLRPPNYFSTLTIEQLSQVAVFHKKRTWKAKWRRSELVYKGNPFIKVRIMHFL